METAIEDRDLFKTIDEYLADHPEVAEVQQLFRDAQAALDEASFYNYRIISGDSSLLPQ